MDDLKLRHDVIDTSLKLIEMNLIARTWGNISVRLDEKHFIITPSGLDYKLTKPEDLVIVNIDDCSYDESGRKPSSEKKIHALCYRYHKDVNFVIHTHQPYASAVCAAEKDAVLPQGNVIPCAAYGLPGTKKLSGNVEKCLAENPDVKSILLAKHGTLIMGLNAEDTIQKALELEKQCRILYESKVKETKEINNPYLDDYAQLIPPKKDEDFEAIKLVKEKNTLAGNYAKDCKPLGKLDAFIQHTVYQLKYSKMRDR